MLSFNYPLLRIYLIRIIGAFFVLISIFWITCHLWLPREIKSAVKAYGEKIGYEIAYQDLSISPLRLRIEVGGLRIADGRGSKLLEIKKSLVMLKWSSLMLGEIGFNEILFKAPSLQLEKRPAMDGAGQWNWQDFLDAINRQLPPSDPKAPKSDLKISVDVFTVSDASLLITEPAVKLREEFKPFSIELIDIANYDKSGEVNGVRGQYGLNLGALHFTLPGLNKKIAFQHVAIKGILDNSGPEALGAQVNLELDEARIQTHWDLRSGKSIAGKVQVVNLSVIPFVGLIPANKALQANGGVIQSEMAIELKGDDLLVSGEFHLNDLDLWELGQKQALISWKAGDINRFTYKSAKGFGPSLSIDDVIVTQPVLRFEIDDKGFSNFRGLFSNTSEPVAAEKLPTQFAGAGQEQKPTFHFDANSIKFRDGEVFFADLAMRPNFHVDIKRFNATFSNISNAPGKLSAIVMDGVVARSGSMSAKGQASLDDPRRNNDVTMNFKNLPLNAFNPAVMTFAGYQIASGRLNLNLHYQAKDAQLQGSNQIVIKNVELGDEVADFQGKKLPLGLAIALLEDSNDTIDVTINIAGNVDSPEFSASGLVWQAISNVLTNVATAPFRALGALLSMGASDGVNAVLGEAVYLPADEDRLDKFGEYLAKRPHSSLELAGTYDPSQDKAALARAIADTAILKAAGITLATNEPVPNPNFTDAKVQSGLKAAYAEYVGRIKLGQRLLTLPEGEARNDQLHAELIASIPVTDEDLKNLANSRAKLALDLMIKNNPSLTARITLGEVKTVRSGKEGVPLEVELRIK